MTKMLLLASALVLAACGDREADAPPADATGEMAPAAGSMDTTMMHDSAMMGSDTAMARDTAR